MHGGTYLRLLQVARILAHAKAMCSVFFTAPWLMRKLCYYTHAITCLLACLPACLPACQVDRLRAGRQQPFYRLLVDIRDRRSQSTYGEPRSSCCCAVLHE